MNPPAAVRHRFLILLALGVAAFAGCAQAQQQTPSDQIRLRFDYAGARALFEALDRPELSQQGIVDLYNVPGLAGMVDNVTRFIPQMTRRQFEQHLLEFRETGKEPGHDGYIVWDFKQVLATRGEVEALIGKLEADEANIVAGTLRELEPFRPATGPLTITVYFVAGGVSDGFVPERSREPALYVNLTRARGDLDGVVSNLTHEIFHVMQQSAARRAGLGSMVDEPEKLAPPQRLLANTLWEGTANYAADPWRLKGSGPYLGMWRDRFAQHTKPAKLAEDFALFEKVLNDLQAGRLSWEDAYTRGFSGPENAFYFVGYEMTRVIDQRCGRACIRQLFDKPPSAFFERYIEIYKQDPTITSRFSPATEDWIANLSASAARAQTRIEAFERRVEADRNALKIPGLSFVVIQDGEVLSARGLGFADVERRIPATADTLYHIASVTKTFTAILVLQRVEQGKLDLDEPVSRYSDDFKDDAVKIKHLLSHTSEGTPGEKFSYNPERFEYLKAVLEKKTGKPLRQVFVETFLDPLAMRDSVPGPDVADDDATWAVLGKDNLVRYRENLTKFARPYTYWGDGETVYSGYPPRDFWASAGLLSTVRDLAKYDMAVDRHELLKAETLARAWTPFLSNAGKPLAQGLGWFVTDYRDTRLIWHFGHWGTGFSALYFKVPARRLTFIALANSEALADHQYQVGEDVTNNIFACDFLNVFVPDVANRAGTRASSDDIPSTGPAKDCELSSRTALKKWIADRHAKARKAIPLDAKLAAAYVGRYQLPHRVVTVTEERGRLYIDVPQGDRSELFAETPTQFFLKIRPSWTLTFVKEGSQVIRLDIRDGGEIVSGRKVD